MFPERPRLGGMVFPIMWLDEEGYAPPTFIDKPLASAATGTVDTLPREASHSARVSSQGQ